MGRRAQGLRRKIEFLYIALRLASYAMSLQLNPLFHYSTIPLFQLRSEAELIYGESQS
jgi:hypothetical protein